jgi:16S rRNA processing protein RimM
MIMAAENEKFVKVGYVKDAQGLRGEVFVRLPTEEAAWLSDLNHIQLQKEGVSPSLYVVESAKRHKNGLIVKLEGVADRNASEKLKGFEFLIPENLLISEVGESIYLREVLGFQVKDRELGVLGVIHSFDSNGAQDLIVIQKDGRELLIPFVQPFIERMDFQNQRIEMNLPPGLIEF